MAILVPKNENLNYHTMMINSHPYKVFNQLDENKHISNFYLSKKNVRPHPTSKYSYKIKIYDKFICVPKKMCFLDKTKKHFLVGINLLFTYWIYNVRDNNKYRLFGYQSIKDTEIKELHYLTVEMRRYKKEQEKNPFLNGLNYHKAREKLLNETDKLKEKYQNFIKTKFYENKLQLNKQKENNSIIINCDTIYKKNKDGGPPKLTDEQLAQLLADLDELD